MRRAARSFGYVTAPAGSWRAAGQQLVKLRRPPSPAITAYRTLISVPIGNDGIAVPITFSGAGGATSVVGPSGVGTTWQPAQANIYTSLGQNDAAAAALYVGPLPIAQYQVAASLLGGGAQVALGGAELAPGWFIWAVWTGGTPGALANLYVTGSKVALS